MRVRLNRPCRVSGGRLGIRPLWKGESGADTSKHCKSQSTANPPRGGDAKPPVRRNPSSRIAGPPPTGVIVMRRLGPGFVLIALSAAALSGCGGGGDEGSTPASGTAQPPAPAPPPGSTNHAPTISGTPTAAVNASVPYTFTPTAADADGDTLAFSIQNKPAWAAFNTTTGRLSGTPAPADVGTYSNISITVSDGAQSAGLSAFAIAVTSVSNGRATLSWTAPTANTDGSTLSNLAGYRIRYGTSAASLTNTIVIDNASVTTYIVEDLSPATWYFAVTAINSQGAESTNSNVANKQI